VKCSTLFRVPDYLRLDQDGRHESLRARDFVVSTLEVILFSTEPSRVKAAFQRIFAATIFFGTEQETGKQTVVKLARFHFMDSMGVWFNCTAQAE